MEELVNNAFFWQKIDTLCLSSDLVLVAKRGDKHRDFPHLIFPLDYGYLKALDSDNIPNYRVFKGHSGDKASAVIVCADILYKSIDVRLLIGCNEVEEEAVLRFLNETEFQKTIIVHRGNQIPSWTQIE